MARGLRILPTKSGKPINWMRFRKLTLVTTLAVLSTVLSQITGPSKCPKASGVVGYSDLFTLQRDMVLTSNETLGADGGSFVLCPNTEFDFDVSVPDVDDDIFQLPKLASELDPIKIEASNTEIICGENGESEDSCVLVKGSVHILVVGDVTKVQISGLTFREARNTSVLYSGNGGEMAFRNCVWESNSGDAVILAIAGKKGTPAPSTNPKPSTARPTKRQTSSPTKRRTKAPTSPRPSRLSGPSATPITPSSPVTSGGTDPPISLAPINSNPPLSTVPIDSDPPGSTVPISSVPPGSTGPIDSTPPGSAIPSLPTTSPAPTTTTGSPAPTNSSIPSGALGPTVSPAPSASPSDSRSPSISSEPSSPTSSPLPSVLPSLSQSSSNSTINAIPSVSSFPSTLGGVAPTASPFQTSPGSLNSSTPITLSPSLLNNTSPSPLSNSSLVPTLSNTNSSQVPTLSNTTVTTIAPSSFSSISNATTSPVSAGPIQSNNVSSVPIIPTSTSPAATSAPTISTISAPPSISTSTSPAGTTAPIIPAGTTAPIIPAGTTAPIIPTITTPPSISTSISPDVTSVPGAASGSPVLPSAIANDDLFVFRKQTVEINLDLEKESHSRLLQQPDTFLLSLDACTFDSNDNSLAGIFALRGDLYIGNCQFRDNIVAGGIVSVFDGNLEMERSDFVRNEFSVFPAPVFLDSGSSLTLNSDNCESENTGGDCDGVFVQTKKGDCSDPQNCVGECRDFDSSTCQKNIECYSDWNTLSNAIVKSSATQKGGKFQLCEQTLFTVDGSITIDQPDTELYCGKEGRRTNSCIISGGKTQFEIIDDASGIIFTGITFISSSQASIEASGEAVATVAFIDCEFSGHTGRSVIEVYNGGLGAENDLSLIPDPSRQSMTVLSVNCTIIDNVVSFSPVSNFDGIVYLDGTLFESNIGQTGAILVVSEGQISISNCCFISCESTSLPGVIFVQQGALILRNSKNFEVGSTLPDSLDTSIDCTELFEETRGSCVNNVSSCDGTCVAFPSSVCVAADYNRTDSDAPSPSPASNGKDCFTEWDELSSAIGAASSSGTRGVFIICPNSEMNVDLFPDPNLTPITIASDDISIQCGKNGKSENKCIVFGGERHFRIEGSAKGVKFSGITFMGALTTSISARGDSDADAEFTDCRWEDGLGAQAILIYEGKDAFPTDPDADTPNSGITTDVLSMSISIIDSVFAKNAADFAVISNVGGTLTLERCLFTENSAPFGALTVLGGGRVTVVDNCFISNEATKNFGLINIDENSGVTEATGNFGRSNTVGGKDGCTSILIIESDGRTCKPFDADDCPIAPDLTPTGAPSLSPTLEPSIDCFNNWKKLSTAVKDASSQDMSNIFILCPDTLFDVDTYPATDVSPILVTSSSTTIQCGGDGKRSNNCIVSGGVTQFEIRGGPMLVQFVGVTFEKSRGISIHAAASKDSTAFFIDCEWKRHEGTSVILMQEKDKDNTAMIVGMLRSNFTDNDLIEAAILNIGGSIVVEATVFLRNVAGNGAIRVIQGGDIVVTKSCFVQNSEGAVNTEDASNVLRQEGNFAFGNTVCNGILDKDSDLAALCGTACQLFEADKCIVMDFDSDTAPTASPTISLPPVCFTKPTKRPSKRPTSKTVTRSPTSRSPTRRGTTRTPTSRLTNVPTLRRPPSRRPTKVTITPATTDRPSNIPSDLPSIIPSSPAVSPTESPSEQSDNPTISPLPTDSPRTNPPTTRPTAATKLPTEEIPTTRPTSSPLDPTCDPTATDSAGPSVLTNAPVKPSPSRSREPTRSQTTASPQPTKKQETQLPTMETTPVTFNPNGGPMSYDYTFFYHFD